MTSLRFRSAASQISGHVGEALRSLGVSEVMATQAETRLGDAHFASGFRLEERDDAIGLGELDRMEPNHPDASRIVVYVTIFHEQLEASIAKTLGTMPSFDELQLPRGIEVAVTDGERGSWCRAS